VETNYCLAENQSTEKLSRCTNVYSNESILYPGRATWEAKQMDKFTNMVHYFIWKGGSTLCKTVLYKLCYFSDFDFYELNERSITATRYRRLTNGPAPFFFDVAMESLQTGDLATEEEIAMDGSYKRFRYHSLQDPDMRSFSREEIDMLDWVFDRYGRMTANALSELSHKDVPWIIADDKGEISYEAVFYRDAVTSVRDDEEETEGE